MTAVIDTNVLISAMLRDRDPKDARFLACALAARADYLITGDKDFSSAQPLPHTTVITVRDFVRLFLDRPA